MIVIEQSALQRKGTPIVDARSCSHRRVVPLRYARAIVAMFALVAAATFAAIPLRAQDCNGNGVVDAEDIADGTSADEDGDGVPDECVAFRRGDANVDGRVDIADAVFLKAALFGYEISGEAIPADGVFECEHAANANDDGCDLDIADMIVVSLYTVGRSAIPGPGPETPGLAKEAVRECSFLLPPLDIQTCDRYEPTELEEADAEVALGFAECPKRVMADDGEFTTIELFPTLFTSSNQTGTAPGGFSFGLVVEGGEIAELESPFPPEFDVPGYSEGELDGAPGIVAAGLQVFGEVALEGPTRLARLRLRVPNPTDSEPVAVTLRYADGLKSADPESPVPVESRPLVENLVVFPPRLAKRPELRSCTILVSHLPPFLRGDCNDDGTVDISDAVYALNNLFGGGPNPPCREACDSNGDRVYDISDAVFELNFLFGNGPPPVDPGPDACGPDPDPGGSLGCGTSERCEP